MPQGRKHILAGCSSDIFANNFWFGVNRLINTGVPATFEQNCNYDLALATSKTEYVQAVAPDIAIVDLQPERFVGNISI